MLGANYRNLADLIKTRREELNLTAEQLAFTANVPFSFILELETGKLVPLCNSENIERILNELGLTIGMPLGMEVTNEQETYHRRQDASPNEGHFLLKRFLEIEDAGIRRKIIEFIEVISLIKNRK